MKKKSSFTPSYKTTASGCRSRLVWLTIAIQSAFPVAAAFTPALAAAQQHFLTPDAETTSRAGQTSSDAVDADNAQQMQVASFADRAGSLLANNTDGGSTASAARGLATSQANAEIQQWLSRFGTARVQLNTDKHFSLKNSQFDLLLPLSDQPDWLIFTQGSFHRTEDRNQANLGLGARHFTDNFMAGANTFFDYDLSRQHARSGAGVEYWRNFMKVAANGYLRLTNWKDSRDVQDYKERPANGWDIRTEAYLPAWPQLGMKLNYEQYYGKEVALFGRDHRQKNPHAITAGVTYTPFPLLTLNAEQHEGKSGENDTRLGLEINYQLGATWQQQTSPEAVAALRSLNGSRYDLVNRNNNIVLEYRKNEVITLKDAALITGYSGQQKTLGVTVNSKHGLDHIEWSAGTLAANGGKIIANGSADYSVVLPAYHADATGVNSYTISGVAIDKKGNISNKAETQVTVTESAININTSSLLPASSSLSADGKSQQTLTLTVKDSQGYPVDINEREISIAKAGQVANSDAQVTAFKRLSTGQYSAVVTAGTHPETLIVKPSARNVSFPAATVIIAADNATARLASLSVINDDSIANGTAQDRLKAVVTDAEGNPLSGQAISFTADNSASTPQAAITNAQGEATATVTSLKAGQSKITAHVGATSKEAEVNFVAGEAASIAFQRGGRTLADGVDINLGRVTVTDANGNPVANQKVAITAADSRVTIPSEVITNENGIAYVRTTSSHDGGWQVTATVNGHSASEIAYFYAGYPTANNSSFTVSSASAPADGVTAITLTIVARDMRNNAVKSISRLINFDISALPGSQISEVKVKGNVYTAQLTSTHPVSGTVTANLMLQRGVLPVKVSFTAPALQR
ncbi:inverse autotransporter beta domain-containing protein [Pantoea sp. MBD-2R]|uniref:inverse autotransporter beta domain-containing protein n=1 Tax=Pantoea sp. MBD-2R TaxID=3141540 RepID=UPI0031842F84